MADTCRYGNPMYVPPLRENLNLYLLSQTVNSGYDTYDSCVVAAPSEENARTISPSGWGFSGGDWAPSPDRVHVVLIGSAAPNVARGIVTTSFNAG